MKTIHGAPLSSLTSAPFFNHNSIEVKSLKKYTVTGMSCAACASRVEKAVSTVEGVETCAVSLLTSTLSVEGTATEKSITEAVTKAGYGIKNESDAEKEKDSSFKDTESRTLIKRLLFSSGFLLVLMYISMGHTMLGLPLPSFLQGNSIALAVVQMLLALTVMIINKKFFINGFRALFHKAPNMDTLVALGSGVSFLWSLYELYMMTYHQALGNAEAVSHCLHGLYFESAAMIVTLITVGKFLEAKSKGKTTDAIRSLIKLRPETANIILDGKELTVSINEVKKGDIFVVRPGESIPVDGIVIEGSSAVNEAALTGESIPVDKTCGDKVSAATINQSGFIKCEAVAVGEDTALSQIIKAVSDAAATKAPIAKAADKISGVFVPVVITIAVVTAAAWLIAGSEVGFALARGISVLVISCPCALGLATPVAIMVGNGIGAKNGILFKNAASLERAGKTDIVVLDKTGTITKGEPQVTDILPFGSEDEASLLTLAASLEAKSEHPLAKAITQKANEESITVHETDNFFSVTGKGIEATIGDDIVRGGNHAYIGSFSEIDSKVAETADALSLSGKTPLFFSKSNRFSGIIAVADVIKEDSAQAVKELHKMGIEVVMLTGDNQSTADEIGRQAGVDRVIAQVLPTEKEAVIRELKKKGHVTMVGDGINDAPALTAADSGVAIGAGTDIAIDAADIVLMKSRLSDIPAMIRLSRKTLRNIHQNLFWAFFYNCIGIPLAAGLFIPLLGWELNPMFGAAAMSLSSFCVVSNALRLNLTDIHSDKGDRKKRVKAKKEAEIYTTPLKSDETELFFDGMMCEHCEKAVREALEAFSYVEYARPDHKSGQVVMKLSEGADLSELISAVEKAGYKHTVK